MKLDEIVEKSVSFRSLEALYRSFFHSRFFRSLKFLFDKGAPVKVCIANSQAARLTAAVSSRVAKDAIFAVSSLIVCVIAVNLILNILSYGDPLFGRVLILSVIFSFLLLLSCARRERAIGIFKNSLTYRIFSKKI